MRWSNRFADRPGICRPRNKTAGLLRRPKIPDRCRHGARNPARNAAPRIRHRAPDPDKTPADWRAGRRWYSSLVYFVAQMGDGERYELTDFAFPPMPLAIRSVRPY